MAIGKCAWKSTFRKATELPRQPVLPVSRNRFLPLLLALVACCTPLKAAEVTVEGSAVIGAAGIGAAREEATRRALARAAEFHGARVSSRAVVESGVLQESVQVAADACTGRSEQTGEKVAGKELTVSLRVEVAEREECRRECLVSYRNRLLVAAFALEYPEQKQLDESARLAGATALALARRIEQRGRLPAVAADTHFPYRSPTRAPLLRDPAAVAELLAGHGGQYLLSGVYRDLGVAGPWVDRKRRVQIEAFLHDPVSGQLLARQLFEREAGGRAEISGKASIGTAAFAATEFGQVWGALLDEIAQWAENHAACLPFIARVVKTGAKNAKTLHIDAGSEAGLNPGDVLLLQTWKNGEIATPAGVTLGRERGAAVQAVVREVYPRFSLVELREKPANLSVSPGDVLYSR